MRRRSPVIAAEAAFIGALLPVADGNHFFNPYNFHTSLFVFLSQLVVDGCLDNFP